MDLKDKLTHLGRQVQLLAVRYRRVVQENIFLQQENQRLAELVEQTKQAALRFDAVERPPVAPSSSAELSSDSFSNQGISLHVQGRTKKELLHWIDQHINYIDAIITSIEGGRD